jgi:predicted RNA-binding protein with RPS1 domain
VNSLEEVLKEGQEVSLWVKRMRKDRIELTMMEPLALEWRDLKPEMVLKGKVVRLETFGVFVDIGTERPGLVNISELAHNYVRTPGEVVKEGDEVDVKILELNKKKKQIKLSMKALMDVPEEPEKEEPRRPARRGKVQKKVEVEPVVEEVIPDPTAMEIALRQAMERQQKNRKALYETAMRAKKSKNNLSEQDEIFERTLKNKQNSD